MQTDIPNSLPSRLCRAPRTSARLRVASLAIAAARTTARIARDRPDLRVALAVALLDADGTPYALQVQVCP